MHTHTCPFLPRCPSPALAAGPSCRGCPSTAGTQSLPEVSPVGPYGRDPALETRGRPSSSSSRFLAPPRTELLFRTSTQASGSPAPRPPGPRRPKLSDHLLSCPCPPLAGPRSQAGPPYPRRPLAPTLSCPKFQRPLSSGAPQVLTHRRRPGSLQGPRGPRSPLPEAAPGARPAQVRGRCRGRDWGAPWRPEWPGGAEEKSRPPSSAAPTHLAAVRNHGPH